MADQKTIIDYKQILDYIPGGVALYRMSEPLVTLYYNDGICALSGLTRQEYDDMIDGNAMKIVLDADRSVLMQEITRAAFEKRKIDFTYRIFHKDRGFAWVHLSATHMGNDMDGYPLYYAVFMDISDERKMQKKLLEIAEHDHLTGALNRISFEQRIEDSLLKNEERLGAFIMLDIDNFKSINDFLGHIKGDEVLCMIAQALTDIFDEHSFVARIGGDEFAVYVNNVKSKESLIHLVQTFQKITDIEFPYQDSFIQLSTSLGIAFAPKDGNTYSGLYVNADKALLHAKNKGKNQYQIYGDYLTTPSSLLLQNMEWLLDEGNDAIYVCNSKTYELLYLNKLGRKMAGTKGNLYLGKKCYKELMHFEEPCPFCKIDNMKHDDFCERSFEVPGRNLHLILKGKLLDWNGIKAHVEFITYDKIKPNK